MGKKVVLNINGEDYHLEIENNELLLDVIREKAGLTGTKHGCGTGECGACTVLIDSEPVNSCTYLAIRAEGKKIITIEGLSNGETLHPLQQAFINNAAVQCGFCGPGMLMSAKALLDTNPNPTEAEIREGIAGNICRCSGYVKIVKAIGEAAKVMVGEGSEREDGI
jgi:carbon-monoxide dehydrogenase small subunit